MSADEDDRLRVEIELLEAMYPDQVLYEAKARELKYHSNDDGTFILRLPSGYLTDERPDVLSASVGKSDAREQLKKHVSSLNTGEEILDSIIAAFNDGLVASQSSETAARSQPDNPLSSLSNTAHSTVIIWLHHLLNTNKRKLALSPLAGVSGVTKPGYPGVLVYSGPAELVAEHVAELKQQNWQAFQIRLESEEGWAFAHGEGVREVEAMGEVVAALGEKEGRKETFLEAMRMK